LRYCGTVMICCGYGSGEVLVTIPAPVPIPVPVHTILSSFTTTKKIAQNFVFSISEAAYFSESLPHFWFFVFFKNIYVGFWIRFQIRFRNWNAFRSRFRPRAKSSGSCGSGSGSPTLIVCLISNWTNSWQDFISTLVSMQIMIQRFN
jgi:hypothetical protein